MTKSTSGGCGQFETSPETERGVLPTGVLPIGVFPTGVLPIGVFPTAGGDSPTSRLQLGVPLQLQFSLKIRLLSIKDIVCRVILAR